MLLQAEQHRRLDDAEVTTRRSEDAQPRQDLEAAQLDQGLLLGEAAGLLACQEEGLEVGLGASAGEDAVRAVAESDAVGGPLDQVTFDESGAGALVPRVHRRVDGGKYYLAKQRRNDDRAVEVGQVARVVEVDRVPQVDTFQFAERGLRIAERRVQVDRRHLRGPAAAVRHQ